MTEISDFANALLNKKNVAPPTVQHAATPTPQAPNYYWPDESDVSMSKKYDSLYGSPLAPYATPGASYLTHAPLEGVAEFGNNYQPRNAFPRDAYIQLNSLEADEQRKLAIAAERNAVSKLGYDPSRAFTSPDKRMMTLGGFYSPTADRMWYDTKTPQAAMHEAAHRGIQMLNSAGKLPGKMPSDEESIVRALMQRSFGDVELQHWAQASGNKISDINPNSPALKQIQRGIALRDHPYLKQLEDIAAAEIARRKPGGPR